MKGFTLDLKADDEMLGGAKFDIIFVSYFKPLSLWALLLISLRSITVYYGLSPFTLHQRNHKDSSLLLETGRTLAHHRFQEGQYDDS